MKVCRCPIPRDIPDPRRQTCMDCGGVIALPEWDASERNHGVFFEKLAEAAFPAYGRTLDREMIPRPYFNLYREASGRHKRGQKRFGYAYLSRDNILEGNEEAADWINYLWMETLRRSRDGRDPREHLALSAAKKIVEAREFATAMAEPSGIPHPISDQPE